MGKNGYLERRKVRDTVMQDAIRQTYQQYMTDMLILTLNDPEVMGKDVFGYKRLKKVLDAWGKNYDKYFDALTKKPEADYARAKIDSAIRRTQRPLCRTPPSPWLPFSLWETARRIGAASSLFRKRTEVKPDE